MGEPTPEQIIEMIEEIETALQFLKGLNADFTEARPFIERVVNSTARRSRHPPSDIEFEALKRLLAKFDDETEMT